MKKREPNLEEINEKLDEVVHYIHVQKWLGWVKLLIWTILIIVLVVLPVYFAWSFLQAPSEYIDIPALESLKEILENLKG